MKRAFRATATGVALTITGGVVVALAVFGVFGAHGAVPRTGPLSVHAGLNDPSGAVVRRDGLFTAKGGRSQLGAAVSGAMIGPLSPVAVRSSDGNIVAYNTWQELRTVDEEQSFSKQGIPDGDVLGTPSLRVHDDAGKASWLEAPTRRRGGRTARSRSSREPIRTFEPVAAIPDRWSSKATSTAPKWPGRRSLLITSSMPGRATGSFSIASVSAKSWSSLSPTAPATSAPSPTAARSRSARTRLGSPFSARTPRTYACSMSRPEASCRGSTSRRRRRRSPGSPTRARGSETTSSLLQAPASPSSTSDRARSSSSRCSASTTPSSPSACSSRASSTTPATRLPRRPISRRRKGEQESRSSSGATASPEPTSAESPHRRRTGCASSTTQAPRMKEVTDESPSCDCGCCPGGRPDDSGERVRVPDLVRVHAPVEHRLDIDDGLAVRAGLLRHAELARGLRRLDGRMLGRPRVAADRLLRPEGSLGQLQRRDRGPRVLPPEQAVLERHVAHGALRPLGGDRRPGPVLTDRRRRSVLLGGRLRLLLERLHQGLPRGLSERPTARS